MVACPLVGHMIAEYEKNHSRRSKQDTKHHEQTTSGQTDFSLRVQRVVDVMSQLGNPFIDDSNQLFSLHTQTVMLSEVVQSVKTLEQSGDNQYLDFMTRIQQSPGSFYDTIHKNNFPLFKRSPRKSITKSKQKIANMKHDVSLFSRLYISCQNKNGDLGTFF